MVGTGDNAELPPVDKYPFTDLVSHREVTLHMGVEPGVEHPDCIYRAEVSPELDCFFCTHCGWNGRISGAWFMDLLMAHPQHDDRRTT
jgi:hypothetical protein